MDIRRRESEEFRPSHRIFVSAVICVFLIFFVRLLYLQVIKGQELRFLSENNRIRLIKNTAPRGMIMDREGRVLVDSRPAFNVVVTPEDVGDLKGLTQRLSRLIHLSPDEIASIIEQRDSPPFQPVLVKRDIAWEELSAIKTHRLDLPGVEIHIEPVRTYPYGSAAAHVLGYGGEINKEELQGKKGYQMGDWVGKYGVELMWEKHLRGTNGGRQVEIDASGKEIRVLKEVQPVPGRNLYLTIDLDLQRFGEELLGKQSGAIIAMDPLTGEILAFCSSPAFQPVLFAEGGISAREWEKLVSDPLHPLQNRGIQGMYPPGSVFKIVTGAAGLEEGVINPDTQFRCTGTYFLGSRGYQCWREKGHGVIQYHRAVVESCDIFFYNVGARLGVETLGRYAEDCGLGRPTGIDLQGEKAGLVPTEAWKRDRGGGRWYEGETISLAIGQSYLLVTPLQLLNLMSAVANGGTLLKPQIAQRVADLDNKVVEEYHTKEIGRLPISAKTLEEVRAALVGVTKEDTGTGRGARIEGMEIAGKTGTAQVVRLKGGERKRAENMPYELRDHAWFVAYVAAHTPLAVVVLVEHGGHGGATAVPLAREMIRKYLALRRGEG